MKKTANFDINSLNFKEIHNDPDYFTENKNGLKAALLDMKPSDYISLVLEKFPNFKLEINKLENIEVAHRYNKKLPIPYLRYGSVDLDDELDRKTFGQEGFHRSYFFNTIGVKSIPVEVRYRDDEFLPPLIKKYIENNSILDIDEMKKSAKELEEKNKTIIVDDSFSISEIPSTELKKVEKFNIQSLEQYSQEKLNSVSKDEFLENISIFEDMKNNQGLNGLKNDEEDWKPIGIN